MPLKSPPLHCFQVTAGNTPPRCIMKYTYLALRLPRGGHILKEFSREIEQSQKKDRKLREQISTYCHLGTTQEKKSVHCLNDAY